MIERIVEAEDNKAIYGEFKKIVLLSVGKRSDDGKRFIRSPQVREEFENSEAFSELIVELLSDADKASEFINGIAPAGTGVAEEAPKVEPKALTRVELAEMDQDELRSGLATGRYTIAPDTPPEITP